MLDTGFVAAVLKGIEATLDELIERVEISELQSSLDVLQSRVTALRVSIEQPAQEPEGIEEREESVPWKLPRPSCLSCPKGALPFGSPLNNLAAGTPSG